MTVIVKSLGEFLTLLVQAFNLSAIFPALVFVLLLKLYAYPLLPESFITPIKDMTETFSETGILALSTVLIAYLLDAANMQILRFFEGYHLIGQFPFDLRRKQHQEHVEKTVEYVEYIEKWLESLEELTQNEPDEIEKLKIWLFAERLSKYRGELLESFRNKYPKDSEYVMPTAFGNVIAASEQYPSEVFGMDAVALWPFLRPILTERQYAQFLIREKAIMDFLVNLTVVLALFGAIFGFLLWRLEGISWALVIKLGFVALSCWVVFYLSVQGAASWGATVRAAFVVFREDLRKRLRIRQATDYEDERNLWQLVSQFIKIDSYREKQMQLGKMIFDDSSYFTD